MDVYQNKISNLQRTIRRHYRVHGRHTLPWRKTTDPYFILVSEIMLQQTQVDRVISKYLAFIDTFPTVTKLAQASLHDVLVLWQGLGYNRRAKALHDAAKKIVQVYEGIVPKSVHELEALPGIGPYTARAVSMFAYNISAPFIETNVRTVLLYHFFNGRHAVTDNELLELARVLTPKRDARTWGWALMDYGAYLKGQGVRTNVQSKHYTKQSKFVGSNRQIRGAILRELTKSVCIKEKTLFTRLPFERTRTGELIDGLVRDGLLMRTGDSIRIARSKD